MREGGGGDVAVTEEAEVEKEEHGIAVGSRVARAVVNVKKGPLGCSKAYRWIAIRQYGSFQKALRVQGPGCCRPQGRRLCDAALRDDDVVVVVVAAAAAVVCWER